MANGLSAVLIQAGAATVAGRWWLTGRLPNTVWQSSVLSRLSQPLAWVLLAALLAVLVGTLAIAGATGAVFAGILVLGFAAPFAAWCALPACLMGGPKLELLVWGDETLFVRVDHLLVAGALLRLTAMGRIRDTGYYVPAALFLGAAGLSVLAAAQRTPLLPSAAYLGQLTFLLLVFALSWSLAPRDERWTVYAWTIPALALAFYGICESLWPMPALPQHLYRTFERGYFHRQANHAAGMLAMAAVGGVALAHAPRWRTLGTLTAVVSLAALAGTHSREGVLACIVGLTMLLAIRHPRLAVPLAAVTVISLAGLTALVSSEGAARISSWDDRVLNWREALAGLAAYPLTGTGLAARHRSFYDNTYVMLAAECGVVGVAALLYWWAALARGLWRKAHSQGAVLSLAALGALMITAVQGLAAVTFLVTMVAGPLYWLAGAALAQGDQDG